MLFVVGAMAALSVDVVTLYTARSEAQLAADSAALAAARVLANSGATSDSSGTLMSAAKPIATQIAYLVATQSQVGGRALVPGTEISITYSQATSTFTNPQVTVTVQRADLPTFFARIWGTTKVAIAATATAEAYNPSGGTGASNSTSPPVAPLCVKPWLLPNIDPTTGDTPIFDTFGNISDSNLLGWTSGTPLQAICTSCTPPPLPVPAAWGYYPGDPGTTFPPPPAGSLPSCTPALSSNYQYGIAGCIQIPISCNSPPGGFAYIDTNAYPGDRNADTDDAVNCLAHATNAGGGDTVTSTNPPSVPFEFVMGSGNPVAVANSVVNADAMVSDSLVTVPVFDVGPGPTYTAPSSSVQVVGFVQLFLNPDGNAAPEAPLTEGQIKTTIINMAGCAGTSAGAQPIIGNGAGPVAVRLISPL